MTDISYPWSYGDRERNQRGYFVNGCYVDALCDIGWRQCVWADETNIKPSPELREKFDHELRWLREPRVVREEWTRGEQRQLDLDLAARIVEEALVIKELREWRAVSDMQEYLSETDDPYNPLLLGNCLCSPRSHPNVLTIFPPVRGMLRRFRCVQIFL